MRRGLSGSLIIPAATAGTGQRGALARSKRAETNLRTTPQASERPAKPIALLSIETLGGSALPCGPDLPQRISHFCKLKRHELKERT